MIPRERESETRGILEQLVEYSRASRDDRR